MRETSQDVPQISTDASMTVGGDKSPQDWARLSALLDDVLTMPVEQRIRWVDSLPVGEAGMQSALRELVARAAIETDDFMRRPVRLRGTAGSAQVAATTALAGMSVGPYRLLREIGTGGMSAVWLAERADGLPRRRVALKLPRLAWDTPGLAERMTRERDILAKLEHPNIARLYDAGFDEHGRPYLAMEYVEGRPLDVYCNEHGLGLRERLGLFLQIVRAVAHAHARLVVHRDLKPSNLLVTSDGSVRLLDFGIAKLIEGDPGAESARETRLTRLAGRALTPEYAAPEQIRGETITVAVDVYSLGVVLFELVAGQRPYRIESGTAGALEDLLLREEAPLASTRVGDKAQASSLRGDVDSILGKALKKMPAERYATIDAFAADVQRHLDGSPVLARPDSVVYRLSRFVRKHRLPAALVALTVLAVLGGAAPVAAVMLALAAGAGVALWQAGIARMHAARAREEARQAQRDRDRAMLLLERHEATLEFIQTMLTQVAAADEKLTLTELLERSEALALVPMTSQSEHHAMVLDMLASFYVSFGDYLKAERLLRHAIEVVRSSPDMSVRARIECNHALALSECGSVEVARRTIESWLGCADVEPLVAALCQQYLAQIARNHNDAKGALANILAAQARLLASRDKSPLMEASFAGDLAFAYHLNGRFADADRQYALTMKMHRDLGYGESPNAVAILNNWGLACMGSGSVPRALEIQEEVLRIATRRKPGGSPPPYAVCNHAHSLWLLGRYDEAWTEAERAWRIADQSGAAPFKISARVIQTSILRERGDLEGAMRMLAELAPAVAEVPEDCFAVVNYRSCARQRCAAPRMLRRGARHDRAGRAVFESRGMRIGALANALRVRAEILWQTGNSPAARSDLRRALEIAEALRGDGPHSNITGLCKLLLAQVERSAGNAQESGNAPRVCCCALDGCIG